MKRNLPWAPMLALASSLTGLIAWAESSQPLPTPFPEARYRQMSAKSPFAVASVIAAPAAAATPGFASQLYVDGVAHVGNADFVAIKSRDPDKPKVIFLQVGDSEDGLKIERVSWSEQMGKSTVDVSKAGEKATLAFDEMTVKNAAGAPPPGPPGLRLPITAAQARFPMQPGLPPQFNRFYPQPPAQVDTAQGNNATNPAAINNVRRRIRGLIQSGDQPTQ